MQVSETGGSDEDAREQLVKVVEEKSVEAFAQVYAAAQANYAGEGDCSAEVRDQNCSPKQFQVVRSTKLCFGDFPGHFLFRC